MVTVTGTVGQPVILFSVRQRFQQVIVATKWVSQPTTKTTTYTTLVTIALQTGEADGGTINVITGVPLVTMDTQPGGR